MVESAPQTRSDWVYERLKHAIISGELQPGTRLVAAELAQRWALSPTPLREAFQRALRQEFPMEEFICYFNRGGLIDHVTVKRSMELCAQEVIPHCR